MWTWERGRQLPLKEPEVELGVVTLGGDPAGVLLGGERRWVPVYGPGGYCWRPSAGDRVLVAKAGGEGESPCILGTVQEEADLRPGEVRLSGGNSAVRLGQSALDLSGYITVNGQPLEEYIKMLIAAMLG